MSLFAVTVAQFSTSSILHSFQAKGCPKEAASDLASIPGKIKSLRSKANARDKLKSSYGSWYVTRDADDFAYGICTTEGYPQRHAYGLIEQIKQTLKKINSNDAKNSVKAQVQKSGKEINKICQRYTDLKKVDKVRQAQAQVDDLEHELHTGIKKVMGNRQELNILDSKAQKMKLFASEFASNADTMERTMFWKKWKCYLIIGSVAAALFLVIALIIYSRLH